MHQRWSPPPNTTSAREDTMVNRFEYCTVCDAYRPMRELELAYAGDDPNGFPPMYVCTSTHTGPRAPVHERTSTMARKRTTKPRGKIHLVSTTTDAWGTKHQQLWCDTRVGTRTNAGSENIDDVTCIKCLRNAERAQR